jgi:hypothetical protein
MAQQSRVGQCLLIFEAILSHSNIPYSYRTPLGGWSARPTTLSRERYLFLRQDLNIDCAAIGIGRLFIRIPNYFYEGTKVTTNSIWHNGTHGGKAVFKVRTYIRRKHMNQFEFKKHISFVAAAESLNSPVMSPILTKCINSKFYNDFI